MTNTTRTSVLAAAAQLAKAADRCAKALAKHQADTPEGFAWSPSDLREWAEHVRVWVGDMQAPRDLDAPQILPEDCAV